MRWLSCLAVSLGLSISLAGSVYGQSEDEIKSVIRDSWGTKRAVEIFVQLARDGNTAGVGMFLSAGIPADIDDEFGGIAIVSAASEGQLETVKLLLSKGSQVNVMNKWGDTPLTKAAQRGHVEVVKLLLDNGADINIRERDDGASALLWATSARQLDVVMLLIERGADVNIKDNRGGTPLFLAKAKGYAEIVKVLQDAGAK